MNRIKFGTGGFRAVIGEDFTKENIQITAQAICNLIIKNNKKKEVCIGYDYRFMSENFAIWCAEVFAGNNIKVELMNTAVSTPVVMYATKIKKNDYGVMITASHNPYEFNGIKIFIHEGRDAGVEETKEIEEETLIINNVKTIPYEETIGKNIFLVDYREEYVQNIINLFDLKNTCAKLNIIYDAMHGSTAEELKIMSVKMGVNNYKILNENRDTMFGGLVPSPTLKNVGNLQKEVLENKASIGFALDSDGDRLGVVDEKGNYVDNNYILAICYYFLVKYCGKKGDSIKNVATANLIDKVSEKLGYKCIEVPVGFKYVSAALIEHKAVIGGESSGGLAVHGHIFGKDSLLAIGLVLKAMSVMKKSFSEIFEEVKLFVGGYTKIIVDRQYSYNEKAKAFIDEMLFVKKDTPKHRYEVDKIVYKEYIKVYYKNGNWSLIRFSGTEPILRIFVEADTEEESLLMLSDWENKLNLKK